MHGKDHNVATASRSNAKDFNLCDGDPAVHLQLE